MLIRLELSKEESEQWEVDADFRSSVREKVQRVADTFREPTRAENARGMTLYSIGC